MQGNDGNFAIVIRVACDPTRIRYFCVLGCNHVMLAIHSMTSGFLMLTSLLPLRIMLLALLFCSVSLCW